MLLNTCDETHANRFDRCRASRKPEEGDTGGLRQRNTCEVAISRRDKQRKITRKCRSLWSIVTFYLGRNFAGFYSSRKSTTTFFPGDEQTGSYRFVGLVSINALVMTEPTSSDCSLESSRMR